MSDSDAAAGARRSPAPAATTRGWAAAITLFFEDLEPSRVFYAAVFGLPVVCEDDNSTVFRLEARSSIC